MTVKQQNFINRIGPLAAADMRKTKVLASLTIAQAILESSWEASGLTVKGNALFGIKAGFSWRGKVYSAKTQECYNGVNFTTVTAVFRAYGSWEESISDNSALLTGAARYKAVVGETDYVKACRAIQSAGYATDPNYADMLINLINTYKLTQYDTAGAAVEDEANEIISAMEAAGVLFEKSTWTAVLSGKASLPTEYAATLINRVIAVKGNITAVKLVKCVISADGNLAADKLRQMLAVLLAD